MVGVLSEPTSDFLKALRGDLGGPRFRMIASVLVGDLTGPRDRTIGTGEEGDVPLAPSRSPAVGTWGPSIADGFLDTFFTRLSCLLRPAVALPAGTWDTSDAFLDTVFDRLSASLFRLRPAVARA